MAKTITFLDDLVKITDIVAAAKAYINDKDSQISVWSDFFNKDGICELPLDSYSVADVRMQIELNDGSKTPDVAFTVDCIMSDGSYSSDIDPNFAKKTLNWDDFQKLNTSSFVNNIIKPLILKLQEWEGGVTPSNCKDLIMQTFSALGGSKELQSLNARQLASAIMTHISQSAIAPKYLFKGLRSNSNEFKTLYSSISQNISLAIERNDPMALDFFKKYPLNNSQKAKANFIRAYESEFPKIQKETKKPVKTKLPSNADSAEELLDLIIKVSNNPNSQKTFISDLDNFVKTSAPGSKQQKVAKALKAILSTIKNS